MLNVIDFFQSLHYLLKTMNCKYTEDFKKYSVQYILNNKITVYSYAKSNNLACKTVYNWIKKYNAERFRTN